jgi:hypothetical protein
MRSLIIVVVVLMLFPEFTLGQGIYRIKGEFSLKAKEKGTSQLVMGNFYYDLNKNQIIYRNFFPEKETWVTSDTTLYHLINDEVVSTQLIPDFSKFSIFHLALTRNLRNFGIEGNSFEIAKVDQDGEMVITTYKPNKKYNSWSGKIMLSMIDGKLFGIIFYDKDDNIIKKQFFEDYSTTRGLPFPGKITEITYDEEGNEEYKVTTYKNIVYNDNEPENLYYFDADRYFSEK